MTCQLHRMHLRNEPGDGQTYMQAGAHTETMYVAYSILFGSVCHCTLCDRVFTKVSTS